VQKPSLSTVQTIVGITAGVISILGAAYSGVRVLRPGPDYGHVVAVVREAKTERPVTDATVEILTPDNALVTTLRSANRGQVRHPLQEGTYRVRVSHPRYGAETRQVRIQPGQTAEVRLTLTPRAGGSSPIGEAARVVNEGVGAVQRFIRGLGL
jgi:hypothetical protein